MNPDTYYQRSEVSNSDLTALKEALYPRRSYGDPGAAFRFGSLVDALITEPQRVDHYNYTVDGTPYTVEEFDHALQLKRSLQQEAKQDPFLAKVLELSDTQRCMVNHNQAFTYCDFPFTLNTRCKWDWWLDTFHFGGDLKTTFASTEEEFQQAIDHFDWDRSRAWYMDIAGADKDFIYAISKKNGRIFKKFITRGDETYSRGKQKYQELAFRYWCITPKTPTQNDNNNPTT